MKMLGGQGPEYHEPTGTVIMFTRDEGYHSGGPTVESYRKLTKETYRSTFGFRFFREMFPGRAPEWR